MKVAHFLSTTAFHGAEAMAAELIRQLAGLGVHNHLLLLDNAGRSDCQMLTETADVLAGSAMLPCGRAFDPKTFRSLGDYLVRHDIDVLHSHKYKTSFYALPVCRRQGRGVVTTYHNWIETTPALRAYAALDRRLARFNHLAVGVSTPVMQVLGRHVPVERLRQIDNGVDTQRFMPAFDRAAARLALGLGEHQLVFGCVGRLSPEKGIERLLSALNSANRAAATSSAPAAGHPGADWVLLLVGDGESTAALQEQARAADLAERVRFLGRRSDTAAIFQALDVYLLPSHTEAFPMALLEAMACGCAVLAAEVGEVARILDQGRCGSLLRGDGPEPWAAALAPLLRGDAAALATLSGAAQAARARVVVEYSARRMAERYLAAYQQAAAGRRRAGSPST
jgi:glycosyltransferase involved in cell wall biosynthesis